jgi:exopolysaccharide production protein ExoZ
MEIKTIQALRAFAAIGVISYHINYMINRLGYKNQNEGIGIMGVDLFFVISGFIMVFTCYKLFKKPKTPIIFLTRRLTRIIPIYWIYNSLLVILLFFIPSLFSNLKFNLNSVISSYLLILSEITPEVNGTLLLTGWTLCYEMYFYLLFAIALFFHRKYLLLILSCIFMGGVILGICYKVPIWMSVATNPILFEFFIGATIATLYIEKEYFSLKKILVLILFITSLSALFIQDLNFGNFTRPLIFGLPSGLFLVIAIYMEKIAVNTPKILKSMGDSSYTLYLIHPFILSAIAKLFILFNLVQLIPSEVFFLLTLISILVGGHIAYLLIEKPLNKFTHALIRKKFLNIQT